MADERKLRKWCVPRKRLVIKFFKAFELKCLVLMLQLVFCNRVGSVLLHLQLVSFLNRFWFIFFRKLLNGFAHKFLHFSPTFQRFSFAAPWIVVGLLWLFDSWDRFDLIKDEVYWFLEQLCSNAVLGNLRILDLDKNYFVLFEASKVFD